MRFVQSGKSTSVMAAMRQLSFVSEAHIVYLDGLEGKKEKWDSNDLWAYPFGTRARIHAWINSKHVVTFSA